MEEDQEGHRGYGGKCIKQFINIGILNMNKVGKEKRYNLNKENRFYDALKQFFDIEKSRYPTFSYIHRSIMGDLMQVLTKETVIVFGSVAAGTSTPESDIDMLIVTDRESFVKRYIKKVQEKYKTKTQPIILSLEKLKTLIQEESQLIENVSKENVFVCGDQEVLKMIDND
jgi:predicted nucleotidyltransferase